jgi:hypothetical protein
MPSEQRGIFVDARVGSGIEIRAVPVVCAVVRPQAMDGRVICGASVQVQLGTNLLPWTGALGASREVVIGNGRQFDGRSTSLGTGEVALLLVARNWPIEQQCAHVTVRAVGWRETEAEIPLLPIGSPAPVEPNIVAMEPYGRHGGVVVRAVDAHENPIGDLASGVSFNVVSGGRSTYVLIRTNGEGASPALALEAGSYEVGDDAGGNAAMWTTNPFEVREAETVHVTLRLVAAAVRIRIRDEMGNPVDDAGLLLDRGHEHVRADYRQVGKKIVMSGFFSQCPGLGPLPPYVRCLTPGRWTMEAYRHGYEPGRAMVNLEPGEVQDIAIELRENPEARWTGWATEPRTRLPDVVERPK